MVKENFIRLLEVQINIFPTKIQSNLHFIVTNWNNHQSKSSIFFLLVILETFKIFLPFPNQDSLQLRCNSGPEWKTVKTISNVQLCCIKWRVGKAVPGGRGGLACLCQISLSQEHGAQGRGAEQSLARISFRMPAMSELVVHCLQ